MALSTPPKAQKFLLTKLHGSSNSWTHNPKTNLATIKCKNTRCCSAIAIDAPSSLTGAPAIRWASKCLQGLRDEMEDDVIVRSDGLDGFSFAAVFDGHAGFSSVKFLRDELYDECLLALQGGLLLNGKDFKAIKEALQEAFLNADTRLLNWLETTYGEDDSGATATVIFIGDDILYISHVGDSNVLLSRAGKAEVLTSSHRPYGKHKSALQEIKRIRDAGGWISNGRICGDIAVSRAFGDMRFKTKKNEFSPLPWFQMLKKGVQEGRWTEKFVSRVQFNNDLVVASPDIYQVPLDADAEFILLASDGLWDYMSSSEVVSLVRNQLRKHGDVQLACEALAQAALDRRSGDNVSIVIADLGRTDWSALPLQQQNVVYELGQAFATIGIVSLAIWMTSQLSL